MRYFRPSPSCSTDSFLAGGFDVCLYITDMKSESFTIPVVRELLSTSPVIDRLAADAEQVHHLLGREVVVFD